MSLSTLLSKKQVHMSVGDDALSRQNVVNASLE